MTYTDVSQLDRGDVVLIPFPFTDLSGSKLRPAILVTNTQLVSGRDGHFVFAGTQTPGSSTATLEVRANSGDASAMGLLFPPRCTAAHIYPHKIATLDVQSVRRRIGTVPQRLLTRILDAIHQAVC